MKTEQCKFCLNSLASLLRAACSPSGQNGSLGSIKDKPAPFSKIKSGKMRNTCKGNDNLRMHNPANVVSMYHIKSSLPSPGLAVHTGRHCPGAHRATEELILFPNLGHCPEGHRLKPGVDSEHRMTGAGCSVSFRCQTWTLVWSRKSAVD